MTPASTSARQASAVRRTPGALSPMAACWAAEGVRLPDSFQVYMEQQKKESVCQPHEVYSMYIYIQMYMYTYLYCNIYIALVYCQRFWDWARRQNQMPCLMSERAVRLIPETARCGNLPQ